MPKKEGEGTAFFVRLKLATGSQAKTSNLRSRLAFFPGHFHVHIPLLEFFDHLFQPLDPRLLLLGAFYPTKIVVLLICRPRPKASINFSLVSLAITNLGMDCRSLRILVQSTCFACLYPFSIIFSSAGR